MRIDVTAEDIQNGVQGDCEYCPVARAVERRTGAKARVEYGVIEGQVRAVKMPDSVLRFIKRFDALEVSGDARLLYIEPFSFDLPDDFLTELGTAPSPKQ